MICEYCQQTHDSAYGSGRFCSVKCARGFSTKFNRKEINKKVSTKLIGVKKSRQGTSTWNEGSAEKLRATRASKRIYAIKSLRWDEYTETMRRHVVLTEQAGKCNNCKLSEWLNKPLILELEHKDGNHFNNVRDNLEFLCPNCHSQTEYWRGRNSHRHKNITDEQFVEALQQTANIRHALIKLGLTPKGANYVRAYRLLNEYSIFLIDQKL